MLSPDRERIKSLICETITMLCKNGLHYDHEFRIDALIGITLDKSEVFLISMNEFVSHNDKFVRCTNRQSISDNDDITGMTGKRIVPIGNPLKDSHGGQRFESFVTNKGRSLPHKQHFSDHLKTATNHDEASFTEQNLNDVDRMHSSGTCSNDINEAILSNSVGSVAELAVSTRLSQSDSGAVPLIGDDNFCSGDDIDNSIQSCSNSAGDQGTAEANDGRLCALNETRVTTSLSNKDDINDDSDDELVMCIKQEPGIQLPSNALRSKGMVQSTGYSSAIATCASLPSTYNLFPHQMVDDKYSCFSNAQLLKSRLMPSQNTMPSPFDCGFGRMSSLHGTSSLCKSDSKDVFRGMRSSETTSDSDEALMAFSISDEDGSQYYRHRRQRSSFSPNQISELELAFSKSHYLTWEMRTALATKLQLSHNVIGIWFQNRRQRLKNNLRQPRC